MSLLLGNLKKNRNIDHLLIQLHPKLRQFTLKRKLSKSKKNRQLHIHLQYIMFSRSMLCHLHSMSLHKNSPKKKRRGMIKRLKLNSSTNPRMMERHKKSLKKIGAQKKSPMQSKKKKLTKIKWPRVQ